MARHPFARKRTFVRPLTRHLLLARPDPVQYGHLALELLMAFSQARSTGARLVLLRPRRVVNPALFELEADGVHVWRPGASLQVALGFVWHTCEAAGRLRQGVAELVRRQRHHLAREFGRRSEDPALAVDIRRTLRRLRNQLWAPPMPAHRRIGRPYLRRRDGRTAVKVRLTPSADREARAAAAAIGIPETARLVAIHAREPGFKAGREVHDDARKMRPRHDDLRNARIETYFDAVDQLVRDGYTVVRLGDSTMTPVSREGVIDLATHPARRPVVDLWCLMRSEFAIVAESGPAQVALLTDTPTLTVNATDPISSFPVRSHSVFLLKRVVDRRSRHALGWRELLTFEYLSHLRNPDRYHYIDNTPAEIASAVAGIRKLRVELTPEGPEQAEFRDLATHAATVFRDRLRYVRKFGADDGFLGEGRIANEYAVALA